MPTGQAVETRVQYFVIEPVTENVPAAHGAMIASAVDVQAVTTRCPGPATLHTVQADAPDADLYVPAAHAVQVDPV